MHEVGARLAVAGMLAAVVLGGAACASGSSAGSTVLIPVTAGTGTTGTPGGSTMNGMTGGSMKAMPVVQLGQAVWQGMQITVRAMAPARFVVVTGTSERMVRPTSRDTMHLMVMLTDQHTGTPIPYATVWATIRRAGHILYDNRQWPMLSRFMGVHYGNNVALTGSGEFDLTLLIGPPQSARHMEYAHVWLHPHRVEMRFHWRPGM